MKKKFDYVAPAIKVVSLATKYETMTSGSTETFQSDYDLEDENDEVDWFN